MAVNSPITSNNSSNLTNDTSVVYQSSMVTTSIYNKVNKHQLWMSNVSSVHRQTLRGQKKIEVDGNLSRQRVWANAYELSQDLREMQLELLEKKYGGAWVSRRAAKVIQNAYRQYSMNKNFTKLRWEADEKRLSRRFAEFSRSRTIWSDMVATVESGLGGTEMHPNINDLDCISSEFDAMSHSHSADNMLQYFVMQKSLKMGMLSTNSRLTRLKTGPICSTESEKILPNLELGLSNVDKTIAAPKVSMAAKPKSFLKETDLIQSELSDSSGSPVNSPTEPMVDLPSACFENLIENQEEDVFNDSFQSDSSQEFSLEVRYPREFFNSPNHFECGGTDKRSPGENSCILVANAEVRLRKKKSSHAASNNENNIISRTEGEKQGLPTLRMCKSNNDEGTNLDEKEGSSVTLCSSSMTSSEHDDRIESQTNVEPNSELPKSNSYQRTDSLRIPQKTQLPVSDQKRKRSYRIGLNLFNKKPENGIKYLVDRKFLDNRQNAIARFLIARKGLSKQMIGEYLGNLQNPFNMEVLSCFSEQIELTGLDIDAALRKFQSYFRMPGEAQKIERLMEAFASRFCLCNQEDVDKFRSPDTVFLLAFAIIMLNTDLHNCSIKPDKKMKLNDFIRNLRGIDDGHDVDPDLLSRVYERIRASELKPGADHVSHVMKVEQMLVGNKPQLALSHRRLVCYCRLYEVHDPSKREKSGQHQREIFLFNDTLMVTKIFSKKKKVPTATLR